jgi:NAD(P)H-hydrate epimerase
MTGAPGPGWLTPLPDAAAMRATDAWAIEQLGIPSLELMERAGDGLAALVAEVAPDGPIAVVCGAGNNGGDGLVAARLLRERAPWRELRVGLIGEPGSLRGDAAANLERLVAAGVAVRPGPVDPDVLAGAAVVVDCVLGTGFAGEPRGAARLAIAAIAASEAPVVAADVPSGVDASSGTAAEVAVRARATATFAAPKVGLWVQPGKAHAGRVRVVDIGIPAGAPAVASAGLIGPGVLAEVPGRDAQATKFSSGHVLVCGGSPGLTGAPVMAARAAMRAGAGYVTACVPAAVQGAVEARLLEVMALGLPDEGAASVVLERAGRGAVVIGSGSGREAAAAELCRELARRVERPVVLDADGLNAHAGRLEELRARRAPTVLSPHEGELGRLLEIDADVVRARRLEHAREAARRSGAVVVLKGDGTVVAAPDGTVAVNPLASPMLATAGTGDVLAGVLGAMLAKGLDATTAACAAVWLHASAGRLAAQAVGSPDGVIAGDVIEALPRALGGATGLEGSAARSTI